MDILIIFIGSIISGITLTKLAMKFNIVDEPNYRKIHTETIPKAGGIGIIIPILIVLIWECSIGNLINTRAGDITFIIIIFFLFIIGIIDDKLELYAKRKLLLQVLGATATASSEIGFNLFSIEYLNYIITIIWIVGFINAINLIDGLDGLAGGIGVLATSGIFIFALKYSADSLSIVSIALIGSLLGFLFWNRYPAKIFMGDTGSLPLGYILAILIIKTANTIGGFGGAAIAIFLVAVPIYDVLLSIIRRKINKRPIFSPDRSHFYNLLMDKKKISHKNTVMVIYTITMILVIGAIALDYLPPIYRYILAIIIILTTAFISLKAGFLTVDNNQEGD